MTTTLRPPASIALYTQLLEAWNRRDADAFAAVFTESGSAVGFDGTEMFGRAEIARAIGEVFAGHPTAAYVAKVREVRALDADVLLLRAVAGMVLPGKSEIHPPVNAIQSLVIVTTAGQARIALLQSTPAAFHGRPEAAAALTRELGEVLRSGETVAHDA